MKKVLFFLAVIILIFAACSNDESQSPLAKEQATLPDTSGLAEFQQLKEQQEVDMQALNESNNIIEEPVIEPAPRIIYRTAPARTTSSSNRPVRQRTPVVENEVPDENYSVSNQESSEVTPPDLATQPTVGTGTVDAGNDPVEEIPEKKKGWSKAAKGTAIGAGSGAVLGAIISKNKGKGAVIGGIVGAAGGYVLGKRQDKKDAEQ